jgi:hypothetical protein
MCGLVAVINKNVNGFFKEQNDIFSGLLFLDTLRGEDSTGAFVVSNIGNVKGLKEASQAPLFIQTKEFKSLENAAFQTGWAMVGHNRKATRGTITDKNAHPFAVDDKIVLVHNGSLIGDHKHHADTEVDSEAIAHLLSQDDNAEAVLQKVNGAYALIWYNVETKTLHFIRNSQRPLYYMETTTSYIWASEWPFLDFVAGRLGLKVTDGPHLLKESCLVTYKLGDNKRTTVNSTMIDCTFRPPTRTTQTVTQPEETDAEKECRLACAYGFDGFDGLEGSDQTPWQRLQNWGKPGWSQHNRRDDAPLVLLPPAVDNVVPLRNNTQYIEWKQVQKAFLASYGNPRAISFKEFQDMHAGFNEKQRLTVIVNDIVELDPTDPKNNKFVMIGSYAGNSNVYSAFLVEDQDFNQLIRETNETMFSVEYERILWDRLPGQDSGDIDDKLGSALIFAKNPKLLDIELTKVIH